MKKVIIFNKWFSSAYNRLRNKLICYYMLDEDAFHNTYLFILKKIVTGENEITDYYAYFMGCYKKEREFRFRKEQRYCYMEDWVSTLLKEEEPTSAEELAAPYTLAKDILNFVKAKFPHDDYQLFRYKNLESKCTYQDLADYAGISQASVFKKINAITSVIRENQDFISRNSMLITIP